MKRKTALLLSIMMLLTILLPVQSFGAEGDKGLENAIKVVKEKFEIPGDFTFDYSVNTGNGKNIWYLNWNSKDSTRGNISARVSEDGTILGYDNYKPQDYPRQKKFPKVSRQEAVKLAEAFIGKVNPAALSEIRYKPNDDNSMQDYAYYLTFVRIVGNIPLNENSVSVSVNSDTGEVLHYNYVWEDTLVFPKADGAITAEAARKAFKDNLGLRLVYNSIIDENGVKPYAVYTPVYNPGRYFIDAMTGSRVEASGFYPGPYFDGRAGDVKMEMSKSAAQAPVLTPDELKAVEEVSKLLTVEQAEKTARNSKALGLSSDFKLSNSNLSKRWPMKSEFTWYLNFTDEASEKKGEYRSISASIDAKTGEILNFYSGYPYKEGQKAAYNKEASKKAVESFLKEFNNDKYSQTEYDDSIYNNIYYMGKEDPSEYTFTYVRKVNGILFPGNAITVRYDAVNGRVSSFDMNWYSIEFPAVDKAIKLDDAYDKFFSQVGLELQYKLNYPDTYKILPRGTGQKPEVLLVYTVNAGKPYNLDADTGVLLGYDGKPYKENKPAQYTDISGHFAEKQITALAEYGISLDGTEFKPNDGILQKDYLNLLTKVLNFYYWPLITKDSSDKEIDNLYNTLIREGVVKPGEKAPDSPVSREDAVKFLIRGLKYNEVADLKDIFKSSFKDESNINPDLTGYVAIAGGLKIVSGNGGYFRPKDALTRAEAMIMIYNYLQR